jgi:hypothetical protein
MNTACSYHPDNLAIDICERCNRPICLEGKRVYHKRHSSGTGSHHHTWTTTHTYCVPCNTDVVVNANTGPGAIFGGVFFIVIAMFVTMGFLSVAGPLAIIPLGILIFGIYNMTQAPKRADKARQDEQRFLNSLNSQPKGIDKHSSYNRSKSYIQPQKTWSLSTVHCFECGEELDLKARFCMNCGDSTVEEREYLENQS